MFVSSANNTILVPVDTELIEWEQILKSMTKHLWELQNGKSTIHDKPHAYELGCNRKLRWWQIAQPLT